jgi:hypothetical protein
MHIFIRVILTATFYPGNIVLVNNVLDQPCTAFEGYRRIAAGTLREVVRTVRKAPEDAGTPQVSIYIYDDSTGRVVDVDMRGTEQQVEQRLAQRLASEHPLFPAPLADPASGELRGRGRPRLGVVAREVTLLPRHWDWLGRQPGGASVALRKLVEEARRTSGDRDRTRAAQEAAYRFMSAVAGNLPGFEEASRALFAYDRRRFGDLIAAWPEDVRDYAIKLAFADLDPGSAAP